MASLKCFILLGFWQPIFGITDALYLYMTTATPAKKTTISILSTKGTNLFVTGVSFADGPGYKVKSVRYHRDAEKAMPFALGCATEIAQHLSRSYSQVTLNGVVVVNEFAAQDAAKRAEMVQAAHDLNREFVQGLVNAGVLDIIGAVLTPAQLRNLRF